MRHKKGEEVIAVDPRYFRPTEVDLLRGNPAKAWKNLGWKAKVKLPELVTMMMASDMQLARKELLLREHSLPVR